MSALAVNATMGPYTLVAPGWASVLVHWSEPSVPAIFWNWIVVVPLRISVIRRSPCGSTRGWYALS